MQVINTILYLKFLKNKFINYLLKIKLNLTFKIIIDYKYEYFNLKNKNIKKNIILILINKKNLIFQINIPIKKYFLKINKIFNNKFMIIVEILFKK